MSKYSLYQARASAGFTLLEVLVAIAVTAIIAAMATQAFDSASLAHERTKEAGARIQRLDRAWLTLETDLRNTIARVTRSTYGDVIPAMKVEESDEDWLTLLRGGRPNPLHFYRSELVYVAYSVEDGVLVRESWIDPANLDEDLAYRQKILADVEEVRVRVLPPGARSAYDGPWVDDWPPAQAPGALPRALEITLMLEGRGEITRLFALTSGLGS